MARESDRIPDRVACLNTQALPATLISTRGFNCEVWQSAGVIVRDAERVPVNFVVKRHRFACTLRKVRVYQREYRRLRAALAEMVPEAVFVATRVDGDPNVVVLAEARAPWFDLAQQGAEDEARPLLERMPRAREQLARFVAAARHWQGDGMVVDLYGSENLVLDRDRRVSYLDSFGVFFYEDTLHAVGGGDDELAERIAVSRRRLEYLASLLS
jgi:uncharacterized protein YjiS (DUF1127 family)